MEYDIQLRLPDTWNSGTETYIDESGCEIMHLEATLQDKAPAAAMIDIYLGEMPEDETAEDQAYANYAETVGFDENDPEDFQPISQYVFNGKKAWGFDALCEDDAPMRFLSQEVKKGMLAIMVFVARDADTLEEVHKIVERNLRIKTCQKN